MPHLVPACRWDLGGHLRCDLRGMLETDNFAKKDSK